MPLTNKDLRVITILNLIKLILEDETHSDTALAWRQSCGDNEMDPHLLSHRNFNTLYDIPPMCHYIKFVTDRQVYTVDAFRKVYLNLHGLNPINPTHKGNGEK